MLSWIKRRIANRIRNEINNHLLYQPIIYGDPSRINIANSAVINNALLNVSSGRIVIEDYAFFGHNVSLLTGTHDISLQNKKRQFCISSSGRDIIIRRGVWISSNATVLGPCIIGEDAVVAAGAVVTSDVAPGTVVGGVPAKIIKKIVFKE